MSQIKLLDSKPKFPEIVSQALILCGLVLVGMFIGNLTGFLVAKIAGMDLLAIVKKTSGFTKDEVFLLKWVQVTGAIFTFIVPALLMPLYLKLNPGRFLGLGNRPGLFFPLMVILIFITFFPFIEWLILLNRELNLPDFLDPLEEWIFAQEARVSRLTGTMLRVDNTGQLLFNIFVLAIIPALAEELFFRGLLQRIFYFWTRKAHLAIWVAAILFSTFHFQFLGFLPRLVLGLLFGYLLYWSGKIWIPVFAHFINNFLAVIVPYLGQKGILDVENDQTMDYPYITVIISLFITAMLLFYLSRRTRKRKKPDEGNWKKVFTGTDRHRAEILAGALEAEGIHAVVMDKKDSSYLVFGEVEIYVAEENFVAAEEFISKNEI